MSISGTHPPIQKYRDSTSSFFLLLPLPLTTNHQHGASSFHTFPAPFPHSHQNLYSIMHSLLLTALCIPGFCLMSSKPCCPLSPPLPSTQNLHVEIKSRVPLALRCITHEPLLNISSTISIFLLKSCQWLLLPSSCKLIP
jgi:hypothetical protein